MMKVSGIYIIQSISKPERVYVGSAIDFKDRWGKHFRDLRTNKHHSPQLQNHYNKYGEADLSFEVIESGEYAGKNHLLAREQGWFDHFINGENKPYFNVASIAGNTLGTKRTEEQCRKNGELKKGNQYMKGHSPSQETRDKIANSLKGKPSPNKGKKTGVIPWNKGKKLPPLSEEHKRKMGITLMGHSVSEETRRKKSIALKGRPQPEEATQKRRRPRSEQAKQNMRDGWAARKQIEANKKPIIQYSKDMVFIKEWDYVGDAVRELGVDNTSIYKCLVGQRKSAGGFVWRYKFDKAIA